MEEEVEAETGIVDGGLARQGQGRGRIPQRARDGRLRDVGDSGQVGDGTRAASSRSIVRGEPLQTGAVKGDGHIASLNDASHRAVWTRIEGHHESKLAGR